jgi:hypothetical protein
VSHLVAPGQAWRATTTLFALARRPAAGVRLGRHRCRARSPQVPGISGHIRPGVPPTPDCGAMGSGAARRLAPDSRGSSENGGAGEPDHHPGEADPYGTPAARMDYSLCDNDKAGIEYSTKLLAGIATPRPRRAHQRPLRPPHRRQHRISPDSSRPRLIRGRCDAGGIPGPTEEGSHGSTGLHPAAVRAGTALLLGHILVSLALQDRGGHVRAFREHRQQVRELPWDRPSGWPRGSRPEFRRATQARPGSGRLDRRTRWARRRPARSSSVVPPQIPWACPVETAKRRHCRRTWQPPHIALAVAICGAHAAADDSGKKRSGSDDRHAPDARQSACWPAGLMFRSGGRGSIGGLRSLRRASPPAGTALPLTTAQCD